MVVRPSSIAKRSGFTLVELLIVIVVIAILAAVTVVAYNGVSKRAAVASLQSDLRQSADQLGSLQVDAGAYPLTASFDPNSQLKHSPDTYLEYTSDGTTYCLTASSTKAQDNYYFNSTAGTTQQGKCAGHTGYAVPIADGVIIQTITSANCPSTRTRAVDARDNHTYWIQKLGDGKCWMLTNLGYAGGGTNTYGDSRTLTNGTGGSNSYTVASYYVVPSTTNYTVEPTAPSTSTDGTGQYGYLYNFCGANGGQTTSGACNGSVTSAINTAISACPAGWRLPIGGNNSSSSEFVALNTAVNGGITNDSSGIRSNWLAQYAGSWTNSSPFAYRGTNGYYWSTTMWSSTYPYYFAYSATNVSYGSSATMVYGLSVRCVAN